MNLPLAGLTSEDTLRALLDNSSVCVAVLDPDGRVVLWNRGAEKLFGWTAPEAIGEILPVIPPDHVGEFHAMRRRVNEGKVFDGIRLRHHRKDGSPVDLCLTIRPLRDMAGRICAILGIAREATDDAAGELLSRIGRLEHELARTELRALQARLPAHFLFNSLNGISALLKRGDEETASVMLSRLSDLLRHTLVADRQERITLRRELACVEEYLELERIRFGDRLAFEIRTEPAALESLVPTLLLQPLVENAIRHGIGPRASGGHIRIRVATKDERLRLSVADDGRGLPENWRAREQEGIGLSTTRDRLKRTYGERSTFRIGRRVSGGTRVSITLPLQRAEGEVAG